jgi:hypothetical protein
MAGALQRRKIQQMNEAIFALTTVTGHGVVRTGISLGSAIAIVCCWQRNRSILWAILAGFLSWFYVIYFAVTRNDDEVKT